jgi:hypothetical protein
MHLYRATTIVQICSSAFFANEKTGFPEAAEKPSALSQANKLIEKK